MSKRAYDLQGAAEACDMSEDTIKNWIRSGALKAKRSASNKDGDGVGKYIITVAALDACLDALPDA
jgi:hypothetical protein